ncbi:hypothetical protein CNR22_19315 [Sphingobacteriaceae bacterium]|nr:hypothetical protein CNR22_19315 [Sphingobacteriaceae bacterium]
MNSTPGKKKLIRDISANTLQTVITQVFGLMIFYFTSKYLIKDDFGDFNWCMAVCSTLIAISSLGLDLVFVKRIAHGKDVLVMSGIHFFHTLLVALILGVGIFFVQQFVPSFTNRYPFFFYVFLNLAIANVANSFKLCLNGLEAYKHLALISLCVNLIKFTLILLLYLLGYFTILNVVFAYTVTSLIEFVLGYLLINKNLSAPVKPLLRITDYKYFILESLPQLGVVLFDSALARIDWILLGLISTLAATAEYSFAYKVFEISKLPLLIIAPVLLTRFSKLFKNEEEITLKQKEEINFFFKLEMFAIMIIPVFLISSWTPLVDYFTNNKYGAVNETNFRILAACIPLHAVINFLWTLGFVQGQLKPILIITIIVSVLNIVANAILIPLYSATGSSLAFLICTLIQLALYLKYIDQSKIKISAGPAVLSFFTALGAIVLSVNLINSVIFATLAALSVYVGLTFVTRQISLRQIKKILLEK